MQEEEKIIFKQQVGGENWKIIIRWKTTNNRDDNGTRTGSGSGTAGEGD
jgi:hypothetical protein